MKRIVSIFLVLCLCITMCGCSIQKKNRASGSTENALDEEEVLKQAGKILKKMTLDEKIGQMILVDLDELSEDQLEDTGVMIAKELKDLGFNFNLAPCADVWKMENISKVSSEQIRNLAMQEVGPAPAEPKIKKKMSKKKAKKLKRKYEKEHASYEKKVQAYIDRYTVDDANQSCFSSDEDVVSTAAGAMITGMKSQGMATAVKTFPGTAPVAKYHQLVPCQITTGLSKLRRENFSTFSAAIDAGTNMMMAGHVWLTKIDKDFPASLSSTILSDVVRKELGFEGVLFTEALNVPVITSQYSAEEAELKAVIAGADMLYNPVNVEEAVFHVSRAVMFDDIDEKQVDQAVLRILQDKIQQGIYHK